MVNIVLKIKKHNLYIDCIVIALIFCAMLLRVISRMSAEYFYLSLLRSLIYIFLLSWWGISIFRRILQKQLRHYLMLIAALMVFWLLLRTVKYLFAYDDLNRYLWYFYYLPMLFIPLMSFFSAMSLGKSENWQLPAWAYWLYLPAFILFALVISNDLHQLVFSFPNDILSDSSYTYGWLYYLVLAWMIVLPLCTLSIIIKKCRLPHHNHYLYLPLVPFAAAVLYCIFYIRGSYYLWLFAGDITVTQCLLIVSVFECCIRLGLIPSNIGYEALFQATTVKVQITDKNYTPLIISSAAQALPATLLTQAAKGTVLLDNTTILKSHPLRRGYVFWQEDIHELVDTIKQLELTRDELYQTGNVLAEENAQKAHWLKILEQNHLYDLIEQQVAPQIAILNDLLKKLKCTDNQEHARHLLGKTVVIGTYIKRRSNLIFITRQKKTVAWGELELCLNESAANLRLCHIPCKINLNGGGHISAACAYAVYDLFEEFIEQSFDVLDSLLLYLEVQEIGVLFNLCAACTQAPIALKEKYPAPDIRQDDDGLWYLTATITTEGEIL